jgi:uncharacterized protein YceK
MRPLAILGLAAFLCIPAGCSTIRSFTTAEDLWVYSGTRQNVRIWTPGMGPNDCTGMIGLAAIFDFPFSLVLDTVALPVTCVLELFSGGAGGTSATPEEGPRRPR